VTDDDSPRRRSADTRVELLERDMREVLRTVRAIDDALRFPENSPLGRQLIERADRNASNIAIIRQDVDVLETRFVEMTGVVKALRIISLLIGICLGVFGLLQVVHP
jgi:hypothetical protein